ncbi:hypothetical protein QOT17_012126 [Balamuthia mandrillaris]
MVCLDLSTEAKKALALCLRWAKPEEDEVLLVSIAELYSTSSVLSLLRVDFDSQILEKANHHILKGTKEMMLEYEEECTKRNLQYSVIVEAGDPRERICTLAKEHGVDFLFLGKKGKTTLERYPFAFLIPLYFVSSPLT